MEFALFLLTMDKIHVSHLGLQFIFKNFIGLILLQQTKY